MKTKLILLSLFFVILSLNATTLPEEMLSSRDIAVIEKGILKEALSKKDYNDIGSIGISFYTTSQGGHYTGDKKALEKRALELLYLSTNNGNLPAGNYLVLNFLKSKPKEAHKIAKQLITKYSKIRNKDYLKLRKGLVTMLASLTLDNYSTSVEEVNFALQALDGLKSDEHLINFYRAFLFKSIESNDIADMYLNRACDGAKESKIIQTCRGFEL